MARNIRRIVGQGPQREGVFIDILALEQQFHNEISTADVMHQIAELPAAEWIVAEILDHGASIGVSMRLPDLVFRESGISFEQERPDLIGPCQVYDLLVRQNRVCGRTGAA